MLAEMLIAAAIVLTLLGTAMSLVDPARGGLGLQPHVAEVHQRPTLARCGCATSG